MSCVINTGYSLGCKDNTGGIRKAFIGNFSSDTTYTYDANNIVTGVTSGATYYTFEQRQENGDFSQEGNHSPENGTNFWAQNLTLIFQKNEATLRDTLLLLAKSSLTIIVQDQNNKYWLLGKNNACELTASTSGFGKAYGDLNGVTVTLTGKEPEPANEMSSAAFASLTVN